MISSDAINFALNQHAIVSITDAAGSILEVNEKFCAISGYSRDALLGQNHRLLKSGRHPASFYEEMWETISAGKTWQGEVCNRRSDGGEYWVRSTITPVLDPAGLPEKYISIRTDITDIKKAELAVRESEIRYHSLVDSVSVGIVLHNQSGQIIQCNPAAASILGLPLDTIVGRMHVDNAWHCIHPDGQPLLDEDYPAQKTLQQGISLRDVLIGIYRADGRLVWINTASEPIHDPEDKKKVVGAVVSFTDVTERRYIEARFAFAVEGAGDGVWDWNIPTGDMPLSGNYEGMLGYGQGEIAQNIDAWAAMVHPLDLPRVQKVLADYLSGISAHYTVELRMRCKNGEYKWVLCRGTLVERDVNGNPARMIGIHTDIEAQKRTEAALVTARETAERANRAKSDFLSSMSHELRTPLNAIIGFAQMLEYDEAMTEDQQDNVHEILKAGRHLLTLINEVLDLAKIEAGRIDLSMEGIALEPLAEECRQLIQPAADKAAVSLSMGLGGVSVVFADRVRLKQVLLNLLSNAIKYNKVGGKVDLSVTAGKPGFLNIEICDTGVGIPAHRIGDLFQPFNRLGAEAGVVEGTGIGLTITSRLVEMMGGKLGVESEVGVGSKFWLELAVGNGAKMLSEEPLPTISGNAQAFDVETSVLAIDDNPANLKLIAQVMSMREHVRLTTAHTPELGIELALAHRPDIILLDINMPGMDGYQVLKVCQANPALFHIPVVAITANAMPRDIEKGKAAGFADYLTKPIDIEYLLNTVERLSPRIAS